MLGVSAVIIVAAGFFWFMQSRQTYTKPVLRQETSSAKTSLMPTGTASKEAIVTETLPNLKTARGVMKNTYMVQHGDSLWIIASKRYGDGFKWTEIAKANNLKNPGLLFAGTELKLPVISPIIAQNNSSETLPTSVNQLKNKQIARNVSAKQNIGEIISPIVPGQNSLNNKTNQSTYLVQRGDNLWNIAIKEYNNGFKWTEIAKANNLANPRLIHAGNILQIPQNNNS